MTRRTGAVIASFVVLGCLAFAAAVAGMLMAIAGQSDAESPGLCGPTRAVPVSAGASPSLSPAQRSHAQTIVTVGARLGVPRAGIVVALAVARQESSFTNYANDGRGNDLAGFQQGIEDSLSLPHEAVGSDHGSLGVFQQQWPWWGTMQELMTPAKAAEKFYRALLAVPAWESMTPTEAGQAVQRSAYPDAYADDVPVAEQLLESLGSMSGEECAAGFAAVGAVVAPIAPGVRLTDLRNFGNRGSHWANGHTGTDFSAPCGTPVVAATSGTVAIRSDQSWAGPWLVEVSTGPGRLTTGYAHMSAISVEQGEQVAAGQQLGLVGDVGNATGCHLHFEVHPRGGGMYDDAVDPSAWLAQNVGQKLPDWLPVTSASGSFTVATFNTLGHSHTTASGKSPGRASGPERTRGLVTLLQRYDVDVVGLQEFQRPQYDALVRLVGERYRLFSARGDTENAIAWKPSRFRLVSSGTFPSPYFNGNPRRMPVVQLEDLHTGRHAIFVNVHHPANTRSFPDQGRFRARAVEKVIALIRELERELGLPVILAGDLNDRREAFCAFAQALNMVSANGGVVEPRCKPAAGSGIDWILGTSSVRFDGYERDLSQLVRQTSDHPFVVARARVGTAP